MFYILSKLSQYNATSEMSEIPKAE